MEIKRMLVIIALVLYHIVLAERKPSNKVLMCYVMSWSVYRPGDGKFSMDNIDPFLCTHIIYSYTVINSTMWTIESDDTWADNNYGNLRKLIDLKKDNPYLKVMTCVGGWSEGSTKFSQMAESQDRRSIFIYSVLRHLKKNQLDGLDIDWQFPTKRGGKVEDRDNFVLLLQELHNAFIPEKYTLTVRLMGSRYAAEGYHLSKISDTVDFINLKSYSYHGSWESVTGVNSPLNNDDKDNVLYSIDLMLSEGVESSKLLLGLTTEGNALVLDEPVTNNQYLGKKIKKGFVGHWSDENGSLGYNEICWKLKSEGDKWTQFWDKATSTPYAVKEDKFISFDNRRSFQEKLTLINEKNLGGASLFSLDKDDFKGLCSDTNFTLTDTIRSYLLVFNLDVVVLNIEYPR